MTRTTKSLAHWLDHEFAVTSSMAAHSRQFALLTALALAALSPAAASPPLKTATNLNPLVTINVDAAANRHSIDPNIYGVAFAAATDLGDLNCPLNRAGGNSETRYNWQANASNHAADWYFESIAETSATPGEHADTFISVTKSAGAQAMITVPIMGWVAKLGPNRSKLASFSVAKYGPQQSTDYWMPDAGNGVLTNGTQITGNDPNDANMAVDSTYQLAWVQHLVSQWGTAANGGLRYYLLDNEHSIWQGTHRDVHPTGATMDEVLAKMIDHAQRIKSVDSGALVAGPEEWGWLGYLYSGYDQQWAAAHGWSSYPDRVAHGNMDYVPWMLDQFKAWESAHGPRLLDLLTVHIYPQGGEFSDDTSVATQQLRNRSTRSLWDPNYVDESWIADKVQLIPRLHSWVSGHYPSTKIGITEYNWGAESHINGATTQADILGIFGREGLDLATRWTTPASTTPTYKAMRMYRNYDGAKNTFGDLSVSAGGPNPDSVSTFAALRSSDRALTVMVIAKVLTGSTPVAINLSNYLPSGAAQCWQLDSGNAITRLADVAVTSSSLSLTVPAQSITLLVVPGSYLSAPTGVSATATSNSNVSITWTAVPSATSYQIYRSSLNGAFAYTGTAAAPLYSDGGLSADRTYLYKVVAVAGSAASPASNVDPATTTVFTDDPLTAGTLSKATHVNELRTAVNAMRAAAGLPPQTFTDASLSPGTPIRAVHLSQLRTALDQARTAIGVPSIAYTDPAIIAGSTTIKATHLIELRNGVK